MATGHCGIVEINDYHGTRWDELHKHIDEDESTDSEARNPLQFPSPGDLN